MLTSFGALGLVFLPLEVIALADVLRCVNVSSSLTIAHRGASGYIPEHTLPAYRLAAQLGANYIEPDLVMTKDGEIIARHDILLDDTTDVATRPEFADRQWTLSRNGSSMTGFFAFNFTLAEIKSLRCKQRVPSREQSFDNTLEIVTLTEIVDAVKSYESELGISVGIYMEPKQSDVHASIGFDIVGKMVQTMNSTGLDLRSEAAGCDGSIGVSKVIVQSFIFDDLVRLDTEYDVQVPLIYLLREDWDSVDFAATRVHAHGLGPSKAVFDPNARTLSSQRLKHAHTHNLAVHLWDFAIEPDSIHEAFHGDPKAELRYYMCGLRVDGVFANFPDMAVHACEDNSRGDDVSDKRDLEVAVGILAGLVLLLLVYVAYTVYRYMSGFRYFLHVNRDIDMYDDDGDLGLGSLISMT